MIYSTKAQPRTVPILSISISNKLPALTGYYLALSLRERRQ
jgi:hypothetical protein